MFENFKVGDTVRLRSGGPRMTVIRASDDDDKPTVTFTWFDGTNQKEAMFPSPAVVDWPETKPLQMDTSRAKS